MGLGMSDELFEVLRRHRGMDCKRQSSDRQARNRIQVLHRIIERPALEQRLVDVGKGAAEQNGVAVRAGAGDRGGTQRAAGAADVFDDPAVCA
jgi:hypothetical protein